MRSSVMVSAVSVLVAGAPLLASTQAPHLPDVPDSTTSLSQPSWSPDGRWIAFVTRPVSGGGPGDLYLVDPEGTEYRRVTTTTLWEFQPAWSPDGSRLVYQRSSDPRQQWRLGFVGIDGSGREKVSVDDRSATVPAFSPDGDSLAVSVSTDSGSAIVVMAHDGSGRRQLTSGIGDHTRPQWSPDGSRLLYDYRPGRGVAWQLFVVNRDGSGRTQLTTEGGDDGVFSPDGTRIVFASDRERERYDVWIMNADGSGQHALTADMAGSSSSGTFSPDGQRIAFSVFANGRNLLYVMNADGSNKRRLAPD